jgi:hypothetical protein
LYSICSLAGRFQDRVRRNRAPASIEARRSGFDTLSDEPACRRPVRNGASMFSLN